MYTGNRDSMVCHGFIGCPKRAPGKAMQDAKDVAKPGITVHIVEWEKGSYGLLIHYDTTQGAPPPNDIIKVLESMGYTQIKHWPIWHTGTRA